MLQYVERLPDETRRIPLRSNTEPSISQVTLAPTRGNLKTITTTKTSLAATRPTKTSSTTSWLKPTPGTSFLWSLERAIPVNPIGKNNLSLKGMQIYDVDLFDATTAQIAEYKKQGKKVVCYFSAGSFEDWRSDAAQFSKACYCNKGSSCKMQGWDE